MQGTSISGAPEWLVGCCRRSLPPKVLGSGSPAPSHGTNHTGFEDGLRKDWEMLTNIEIIRLEPLGDVLSISSSSNATTTSANHLLLPCHSHRQNMAQPPPSCVRLCSLSVAFPAWERCLAWLLGAIMTWEEFAKSTKDSKTSRVLTQKQGGKTKHCKNLTEPSLDSSYLFTI